MLIAQISDTHIVQRGRKTLGIASMDENLREVVFRINSLVPQPDLVLVTGDITDEGTLEATQYAQELLSQLSIPWYVVGGNHDNVNVLWQIFGEGQLPARSETFQNYVIENFDLRLIGLDSTRDNEPGGEVSAEQLEWLSERLEEAPERPTLLFMHHPPVRCGVLESDVDGFVGADALGEIIATYSNIERIICGHIHLSTHTRWNGTIVSTSPGNGMGLGLDLTMARESEFFLERPSFQLHHWTTSRDLVTHTIIVSDAPGPYRFVEHG